LNLRIYFSHFGFGVVNVIHHLFGLINFTILARNADTVVFLQGLQGGLVGHFVSFGENIRQGQVRLLLGTFIVSSLKILSLL
jgi:hypothetical protein